MLRIVHLIILPGMLLTACAAWVYADTGKLNSKAVEGKQMYSNRPIGYTVPTPYYGTPMAPRFVSPTVVPYRVTVVPGIRAGMDDPKIVAPAPVVPVRTPELAPVAPVPTFPTVSSPSVPQVVEKTTFILREPLPEANVNDELDKLNARLAKIQLEKRQLTKALALIQNIKSETFKVRTVFDLAEYVSRDKNYRNEAEQLYLLAIVGIEALDRRLPFHIDLNSIMDSPSATFTPPELTKPAPPIFKPLSPAPEPVKPEPVVEPKPAPPVVLLPPQPPPIPIEIDTSPAPLPPLQLEQAKPDEPAPKPPILIPEDDIGQNGRKRQPAPAPPSKNENDGIVTTPPVKQPVPPEEAPPALKQQDDPPPSITKPKPIPIPLPEENVKVSPPDSLNPPLTSPKPEQKPFVKPKPAIPLEDNVPEETPKEIKPPTKRPLPKIILDMEEN